jgi:hypothetical protein
MRWTATAETANELRTNAAVRNQNALEASAAPAATAGSASGAGGSPGTSTGAARSLRCGVGRRKRACRGTVAAARMTASVIRAWRQPCRSISQFDSGEKTKLAQPPTSVTAVSACRRRSRNHLVTTVKAAS